MLKRFLQTCYIPANVKLTYEKVDKTLLASLLEPNQTIFKMEGDFVAIEKETDSGF